MKTGVGECVSSLFRTRTLTPQLPSSLCFRCSQDPTHLALLHPTDIPPCCISDLLCLTRPPPELAARCTASPGVCLRMPCALTEQHGKRMQRWCEASKSTKSECRKCTLCLTDAVHLCMHGSQCSALDARFKCWGNLLTVLFSRSKNVWA